MDVGDSYIVYLTGGRGTLKPLKNAGNRSSTIPKIIKFGILGIG